MSKNHKKSLKKVSKFLNNRRFQKTILYGEKLLENKTLLKKERQEILSVLGWAYDQWAVFDKKARLKKQKKALRYFKKLAQYDTYTAWRGIATVYHHQNNPKKAIVCYKKAHKGNPKSKLLYNDLGNAYRRLGRITKNKRYLQLAMNYYQKALKEEKSRFGKLIAHTNLALFLREMGDLDDAKVYAKKVVALLKKMKDKSLSDRLKNALHDLIK